MKLKLCQNQTDSYFDEGRKVGGLEDRLVTFKPVNSLPSYLPTLQPSKKAAFTLAEVLITLAIIGVVAALTIPTLITKMSQKAAEARTKTIEARLLDGINRYSTLEDGLSQNYETTYDFLVGLSKHYKMAQICKADEITNCVPYSTINYTQDGEDKSVEVSTLTSIGSFISGDAADDYLAPASFITGQGTPVVMAFKKDCVWDSGKAMRDIADSGCIAYMYDENGTRNPNKIGKDWIGHGLSIIPPKAEAVPIATIQNIDIMEILPAMSYSEASEYCNSRGWVLPNTSKAKTLMWNNYTHKVLGTHPTSDRWLATDYNFTGTLGYSSTYVSDAAAKCLRAYQLFMDPYIGFQLDGGNYTSLCIKP